MAKQKLFNMSAIIGLPRTKAIIAGVLVLAALVGARAALAQSGECDGYVCVDYQGFAPEDEVLGGWLADDYIISVEWLPQLVYTGGLWPFTWVSAADGVMSVQGWHQNPEYNPFSVPGHLRKTFDLEPGTYWFHSRISGRGDVVVSPRYTDQYGNDMVYQTALWSPYTWVWSDEIMSFVVDYETSVTIDIEIGHTEAGPLYLDHLWLAKTSDTYPTPNGSPTVPPNATPGAVPTEFCNPLPTSNVAYPTATPTPGGGTFALVEDFGRKNFGDNEMWGSLNGAGYEVVDYPNHSPINPIGAGQIDYSSPVSDTVDRAGVAIRFAEALTRTLYLDGYARTGNIFAGVTHTLEVWAYDGATWTQEGEFTLLPNLWRPFHVAISPDIVIVAVVGRRSDDLPGVFIVDDFYIYDNLRLAKYCNGQFPDGTWNGGQWDPGSGGTDDGVNNIIWPGDKPCPGDIVAPNNFWGGLLAQLTLFLDSTFAFMPYHLPGSLTEMVRDKIASPVITFVVLAAVLIDFRVFVSVVGIFLTLEGARAIWSLWMFIKKSIPFLN